MSPSRAAQSVSARIAARLNPAIETAVDPNFRFRAKFQEYSYNQLCRILAVPAGIFWALNTVPFLRSQDSISVYGWRVLAHIGPYHIPRIVQEGSWRHSLELLGRATELQLIESEIAQLLTDIEVVTQRRTAVRRIVSSDGFQVFLPVLKNLASPPPVNTSRKGQSHFEANLRVAMDVVAATPARERQVAISVIEDLLTHNKECWESTINEETRRFREYRVFLLLKLLQNDENLEYAKSSSVVKCFLIDETKLAQHQEYPTLPLMPLLYQFKTEHLGFETVDIVRKLKLMLEIPLEDWESKIVRKSMSLPNKLDFINFEKLVYLTICYSSLRVIPMISEYSMKVLRRAAIVIGSGVAGAAVLETAYRAQEHVIQSAPWYDGAGGLVGSACIATSNVLVGALVLRYFPFCGLPWLMMKVRDSFSDSYRFV